MTTSRKKLHDLIDRLADEELDSALELMTTLYYNLFMLKAIQYAQRTLKPGDSFTTEEAIQTLSDEQLFKP